ncbi:MAG TPA: flagellar brake protein [Gallionellaceae bacterium]|nr:flagellar brake protein [Gallionellaceae bacterium]
MPSTPAKQEDSNPQRAACALPLEQIKLNIGDTLQLQFQSDAEHSRCVVTLIGYFAGQGVIVSTPILDGSVMMIREGQIFVVRLFSGKTAYAFTAITNRVSHMPYPHLHLSYPKEVRGLVVRGSARARANIDCHAIVEGGSGFACVARDISTGGALIAVNNQIGEVGGKISLKMRVKVSDTEHMLILNCVIRSVNNSQSSDAGAPTVLYGLSFENPNSQDTLVISALLYQNLDNDAD